VSQPVEAEVQGLVRDFLGNNLNILTINESDLAAQIGQHPKLSKISIKKSFPATLVISAVERDPAAIVVADADFYQVDWNGVVMDKLQVDDLKDDKFPLVTGIHGDDVQMGEPINNTSLSHALELIHMLKERNQDMYAKLSTVQIDTDPASGLESIVALFKGGMDVKFGDINPVKRLPELETLINSLKAQGINSYRDLDYVDLRFEGKAWYMEKKTLLELARGEFDELEARAREEAEKLAAKERKSDADHISEEQQEPVEPRPARSRASSRAPRSATAAPASLYNLPNGAR